MTLIQKNQLVSSYYSIILRNGNIQLAQLKGIPLKKNKQFRGRPDSAKQNLKYLLYSFNQRIFYFRHMCTVTSKFYYFVNCDLSF